MRCGEGAAGGGEWPDPLGLLLGIGAVVVAQLAMLVYHYARSRNPAAPRLHSSDARPFWEGARGHLLAPGGALTIAAYLVVTWMLELLPCSYYRLDETVRWSVVALQLVCQDALMFAMHVVEHRAPLGRAIYRASHQPHHRFVEPCLFDAFDGTVLDTLWMVLLPLLLTSQLVAANAREYMLFGAIWSSWLCLLHSERAHPWDPLFRRLGLGTPADHHVHHRLFTRNYGHTMMWWDRMLGTYRATP